MKSIMGRKLNQLKCKNISILCCSLLIFGSYLNYFYGTKTSKLEKAIHSDTNFLQKYIIASRQWENQKAISRKISSKDGTNKPKLVVLWTTYFQSTDWFEQARFDLNSSDPKCLVSHCLFTTDRSVVHKADAVLFHAADFNIDDIPVVRFAHQLYVWYTLEAPGTYQLKKKRPIKGLLEDDSAGSRGFFNWTFTYHSSSDIVSTYGYTFNSTDKKHLPASFDVPFTNKLMVTMAMTKCLTDSGREQLLTNLKSFMLVDTFGSCSRNAKPCPKNCFDYLARRYIFHLSFEDALCEDYITDMVWEPLRAGMIPIVYGSGNYSQYLPKNSFIDARQHSPESLAIYLNRLASTPSEIDAFHAWRSSQVIDTRPGWCHLCQKLSSVTTSATGSVESSRDSSPNTANLLKWWLGANKCQSEYPMKRNSNFIEDGMDGIIKFLTEGVGTFHFNF